MPLNDDALTDVASARAWLGEDDADEDALEDGINGVSRSIAFWTGRQFVPAENAVVKKFTYDGEGVLDLTDTELRSITSIVLFTDLPAASQITLVAGDAGTEADYRLEPRRKTPELTYLWLVLPRLLPKSSSTTGYAPDADDKLIEVTITGSWGADIIPGDVKLAANEAVADAFRNPEAVEERQLGPYSTRRSEEVTFGLSKAVRERLRPYKRANVS